MLVITNIFHFCHNVLYPSSGLSQYFDKIDLPSANASKSAILLQWYRFYSLHKRQIFGVDQIESICRQQNKCNLKTDILYETGRKHCGKRRKCCLPAFSPFPTMFSLGCFFFQGCLKSGIAG